MHRLRHLCQGLPHGDFGDRRKVNTQNGQRMAAPDKDVIVGAIHESPAKSRQVSHLSAFLYKENHALDAWFNKAYGGE